MLPPFVGVVEISIFCVAIFRDDNQQCQHFPWLISLWIPPGAFKRHFRGESRQELCAPLFTDVIKHRKLL